MKTPTWKDQPITTIDGFKLILSFEPDNDIDPRHHFTTECGWTTAEYNTIKDYYFFTAKVTAYKGSIECGSAYLGACCYKNLKDVMHTNIENVLGGYAPQMCEEAVTEAKEALSC